MSFAIAEEAASGVVEATVQAAENVAESVPAGVQSNYLTFGEASLDAILGYLVVFIGLVLLMIVIIIVGKIMVARTKKPEASAVEELPAQAVSESPKQLAPGSAGDVKLYDTDPRDAAMIMAIVADKLQKPLNELRFVSIKEVK